MKDITHKTFNNTIIYINHERRSTNRMITSYINVAPTKLKGMSNYQYKLYYKPFRLGDEFVNRRHYQCWVTNRDIIFTTMKNALNIYILQIKVFVRSNCYIFVTS